METFVINGQMIRKDEERGWLLLINRRWYALTPRAAKMAEWHVDRWR